MFIKDFVKKNKQVIAYLFFGVCTTMVNMGCYALFFNYLQISNVVSTVLAWLFSVLFAFVTNKGLVFGSKEKRLQTLTKELLSFLGCRILTGILDVGIMWVAVDLQKANGTLWKLISNILVIVINYIASKWIIFKKDSEGKEHKQ